MDVSVFVSDVSCKSLKEPDCDVLRLHDRTGSYVDVFLPYGSAECVRKLFQQALDNEKLVEPVQSVEEPDEQWSVDNDKSYN